MSVDRAIAQEAGAATVELSGKCPYSGVQVQGTDTEGVSVGQVRSQITAFAGPPQTSVQKRL